MSQPTKTISNNSQCDSTHSDIAKKCGEPVTSDSTLRRSQKAPKMPKPVKILKSGNLDGRGRVCKRCTKCGERAKSNNAASCVKGCVDPFPNRAPSVKKKRKQKHPDTIPKKAKKKKIQENVTGLLGQPSAAALAIFGPEMKPPSNFEQLRRPLSNGALSVTKKRKHPDTIPKKAKKKKIQENVISQPQNLKTSEMKPACNVEQPKVQAMGPEELVIVPSELSPFDSIETLFEEFTDVPFAFDDVPFAFDDVFDMF